MYMPQPRVVKEYVLKRFERDDLHGLTNWYRWCQCGGIEETMKTLVCEADKRMVEDTVIGEHMTTRYDKGQE